MTAATSGRRTADTDRGRSQATAPGLRERKKRELRQRLSDTATAMFLERGFAHVRVNEIAAACNVSEKTVYNYFPTKESLLFDRGDAIGDALSRPLSGRRSVLDAMLAPLHADLDRLEENAGAGGHPQGDANVLDFINKFSALVHETPSLQASMAALCDRLARQAADALARATGTSADDPENKVAAFALIGLWRVQLDAMGRHASTARSLDQVQAAVRDELDRAAEIVSQLF